MTEVDRLLTQIEAQCREARAALADENEGDVRRAVSLIDHDASQLWLLVTSW